MKSQNSSKAPHKKIEATPQKTSVVADKTPKAVEAKTPRDVEKLINYAYLAILLVVGFAIIRYVFDKKVFLGGDNTDYYIFGKALAKGEGYVNLSVPTKPQVSHFPPGYPLLMSLVIRLFSDNPDTIKYFDGLYLLGSVLLLFQIFRKITQNIHLAFVGALLVLVNFNLLQFTSLMMSESSFIFFTTLSIFFFLRIDTSKPFYKDYNFWVFLVALAFSYYIRDLGLAYLAGVCLYALFQKKYTLLFSIIIGFGVLVAPWYLYRTKVGGDGHGSLISYKNPLRRELGKIETFGDVKARVDSNVVRYVTREIPTAIFTTDFEKPVKEKATTSDWAWGVLIILMISWGIYSLKNYRLYLFGILAASFAILLVFPEIYTGVRLSLHLIPIYVIGLLMGVYSLIKIALAKANITNVTLLGVVIPLVLGLSAFGFRSGVKRLRENAVSGQYMPAFQQYFDIGKWIKENADGKQLIICRKPSLMYYFSGNYVGSFKPTTNTHEIIEDILAQKAKYVVVDALGYSSTMRYLAPAINSDSEKFKLIFNYPDTNTYLFEVVPENGYKGEIKDGKREGKGYYKWANGETYEGEWKDNLRNGQGVFKSPRMTYSGSWKDDKTSGKGTITYPDGRKLVCNFEDGMSEGSGRLYLANGQYVVGTWHKNNPAGEAVMYDATGKQIGKGTWVNGQLQFHN